MWNRRTNKEAWEIIKNRKFPLLYWTFSLSITLITLMRDGGIYSLASNKLFSSDDYQLWLFWLGIIFITLGFTVWCIFVLFDYMRLAFFEGTVERNEIKFNANLLGREDLSIAERNFLQDLNKKDRNVQIAFAIVKKIMW